MGGIASRRNAGVEEVDISTSNAYRYPARSGCYFGSHFIMGGERFETTQPEAYLFGDNMDLNFLGNRPVPFPYPAQQANEPSKTLKSLINIRKDSLRFLKVVDDKDPPANNDTPENAKYNIEFNFDTDVRVAITIYYFATEEISNGQATYHPRDPTMNSETFHYKRGANQTFSQTTHIVEPAKFPEEEWIHNVDKEVFPIVIHCVVEDEAEYTFHSHILYSVVEKTSETEYMLKPLKQKQMVDGLCYLIQEIYGIENKSSERAKEDDMDDNGSECVICMSDTRDTIILPCRHLCLCNCCADNLRYQANNCPICRAPFRALLQIRAMRKKVDISPPPTDSEDNSLSQEGVPPGYEAVSLIEALNGPSAPTTPTIPIPVNAAPPQPPPYGVPPSDAEILSKRKVQRQSSNRSVSSATQRAAQQATVEEGGGGDSSDRVEDIATTPKTKKKQPPKAEAESICEIVNELEDKGSKGDTATAAAPPEYTEKEAPSTLLATPEAIKPTTEEEEEEVDVEAALEAAEEEDEEEEEESLHHAVEGGEAPGSPHIDSSASSYSSTNSSKGLLEAPASTKAEPTTPSK